MAKSVYRDKILNKIDDGPSSDRTYNSIKEACGKDTNFRKSLYGLIKQGEIEVDAYDLEAKPRGMFKLSNITFKKTESDYTNPIKVKGLLDEPLKDDNYSKIQKIFKKRIEEINSIYHKELKRLKEIEDLIPLADAIKDGYVKGERIIKSGETIYRKFLLDEKFKKFPDDFDYGEVVHQKDHLTGKVLKYHAITFEDILEKDATAKIYCIRKPFKSQLAAYEVISEFPYFGKYNKRRIVYDVYVPDFGDEFWGQELSFTFYMHLIREDMSFSEEFEQHLDHLPIDVFDEQKLFNHFVIGALRNEENREDMLWTLATDLTDKQPGDFVEKLRIISRIREQQFDDVQRFLNF